MKRSLLVCAGLACLAPQVAGASAELASLVREHRLANGMTWLIVERHQAPVFTGFIRVRAGGADEEPGHTGLAHLFEHMAFKGTPVLGTTDFEAERKLLDQIAEVGDRLAALERRGQGEGDDAKGLRQRLDSLSEAAGKLTDENALATLYQLNGAVGLNATTDKDLTSYFVSLPKNRLALWATVEAARMASPVLRDFYTERDVVLEERRMRTDSSPAGALYEEINQVAFTMSPYRWPVVGYSEDLSAMTLAKAAEFYRRHYVPGNAVGCIVGDVNAAEVIPLLERTFGAIPPGPVPPEPQFSEPPRRTMRRSTVYFDANPRLVLAFRKPQPPVREDFVFDVLQVVLGHGRTSRLTRRLVLESRLAQSVWVSSGPGNRLDNLMIVSVVPIAGASQGEIERVLWEELRRLQREPVSAAELEKAKNRLITDTARSLDTNSGIASALSYDQAVFGDWRYRVRYPKEIASIRADELQAFAQRYFVPENAVWVQLERPEVKR